VVFVCFGNVCRSPMAEGFANCYGSDVLLARSCGIAPVPEVPRNGILAMREKNIDISKHVSRRYDPVVGALADVVVNMSDYPLPGKAPRNLIEWTIADPYGQPLAAFQKTRDAIERQVMALILTLRRGFTK
jgi:protein-tyrosine-phosphatase